MKSVNANSINKIINENKKLNTFFFIISDGQSHLLDSPINIPNKEKYKLITKFPKNFDKDETYEFFVVVASKEKFAILENEKVIDFKKRLSIFGRSKWDMKKIGYSIMRN